MKMLNWVKSRARIRYENVNQSSGEVNECSVLELAGVYQV